MMFVVAPLIITLILVSKCSKRPLSLSLILLTQTTMNSLLTSMLSSSFWLSCFLFLVYMGGTTMLLIHLIYLAPHEPYNLLVLNMKFSLWGILASITVMFLEMLGMSTVFLFFLHDMSFDDYMIILFDCGLNGVYRMWFFLYSVCYLILTYLAIISIVKTYFGPPR